MTSCNFNKDKNCWSDFEIFLGKVPNATNAPRLLSVKNKENELKIDVMALETEAAVEVKESDDKVLEFEPRKSLFSDDEDIMMN